MSALGGVVQLKSIAIEERPVGRLHWSVFSSQRECVWQLTRFGGRKWKSGLNRISHPDWVKLSVKLNLCTEPKYEIFPFSTVCLVAFFLLPLLGSDSSIIIAGLLILSYQSYCWQAGYGMGRGVMDLCWTCLETCLELPKSHYLISY